MRILVWSIMAIGIWLASWGVAQGLAAALGEQGRPWSLAFFLIVHVDLAGIAIPLLLAWRAGWRLHERQPSLPLMAGLVAFVLALGLGIFASDALALLAEEQPDLQSIAKYLLLFAPMALGLALQAFFIVPRAVEHAAHGAGWAAPVAVVAAAITVGIGFWVDQLFASLELALVQAVLGLFIGLGAVLTRSLPLTFGVVLAIMLVNTLAEGKYVDLHWAPIVTGFALSLVMAVVAFASLMSGKGKAADSDA